MKVTEILEKSKSPFPSLELVPPLKGGDINRLYASLEPMMEFNPPYINITCHRDERINGRIITKRPGTVAVAAAVMKRFHVEVVPHILCAYASRMELENDLIDLNFLDIENVMALRGETRSLGRFVPEKDGHTYASELVAQIAGLNRGEYLDESVVNGVHTHFCTGVAGYPEKHYEASDLSSDIAALKTKVDAGADYIITQMFFDNSCYFSFVEKCRAAGITVPIIPGLKPLSLKKHLVTLPQSFDIKLPEELVKEVSGCSDDRQVYDLGIEWCIAQSRELIANGAPAVHYYTMGRAANIVEILKRVF